MTNNDSNHFCTKGKRGKKILATPPVISEHYYKWGTHRVGGMYSGNQNYCCSNYKCGYSKRVLARFSAVSEAPENCPNCNSPMLIVGNKERIPKKGTPKRKHFLKAFTNGDHIKSKYSN